MPTTTDRLPLSTALPLRGLLAVAFAWFAGMAAMALVIRPDAVVVFGPADRMIPVVVASDGALLDAGRFHVAARTGTATVGSLYAAGAWLVWPILGKGCGRS
ncbi:hypothetical protein HL666_22150 [Bradyrhizobium sp. 83002]|uniref:hypothetical protein n=1 Tax=Bradyrhizobium aeschynomenes TaxID=2734909 RepID=UPI001551894C|nr:hypothetical protein [Bradyrhizobium aeschynomenes]NPU13474.1 hypothetical protein [Bradyrhizobium aeschynomenes]NPV19993.1 hypothetical protein [Bradyrhizobium aeschynomenes]